MCGVRSARMGPPTHAGRAETADADSAKVANRGRSLPWIAPMPNHVEVWMPPLARARQEGRTGWVRRIGGRSAAGRSPTLAASWRTRFLAVSEGLRAAGGRTLPATIRQDRHGEGEPAHEQERAGQPPTGRPCPAPWRAYAKADITRTYGSRGLADFLAVDGGDRIEIGRMIDGVATTHQALAMMEENQ